MFVVLLLAVAFVAAHQQHSNAPVTSPDVESEEWFKKYGDQHDLKYTGPLSYMHLPYTKCLEDASHAFDIAILGFPFDTTTSYRPGARLGPQAIRMSSSMYRGHTLAWGSSPFDFGARLIDCGDVPLTPMDNAKAIDQMEVAYSTLLARPVQGETKSSTAALAKDGKEHPRLVTLGGDHTIALPILRSLQKVYGPISVIHFDAHFDTANVEGATNGDRISHGSYFTIAAEEHLLTNTSIHGGIRQKMGAGNAMVEHDEIVGFAVVSTEDIDNYGIEKVIQRIRQRVGTGPVYLSLDIDVIDPGMAPATGTPEPGGWTTREVKRILRGLAGLNFVGCDVVEVAPAYDQAEITSMAAAGIVADFLLMLQADEPPKPHVGPFFD
ncbi:arginase family-domain-containing protein [Mycena metata]|uniref:Arginase family-domain-containing protein n=1 Tax=Mycena metata TaxID=1033252 RepID=A0AAD7I6V6_9AGAR|nr:arginase family-domain-containing protein [Mycena metata]